MDPPPCAGIHFGGGFCQGILKELLSCVCTYGLRVAKKESARTTGKWQCANVHENAIASPGDRHLIHL